MTATTLAEHIAARRSDELDQLLILWHHWQRAVKVTKGHGKVTMVMGDRYRVSRQYDDVTGVLDDDLDRQRCGRVEYHVQLLPEPYRSAIYILARNLVTGRSVWLSPRLPAEKEQRDRIVDEARHALMVRLVADGVIT